MKLLYVVGYYNKKAIITDDHKQIYYIDCTSDEFPLGTVLSEDIANPITLLEAEERRRIELLFPDQTYE